MEGEKECILTGYPNVISYDCTKKIIEQMEKNICKLKIGKTQGTGFFCKIPFPNENNMLPVLMTNNHIIDGEFLFKKNENISLEIEEEKNPKTIYLDNRIKYTNKEYDITIIELLEKDGIKNYLSLDEKIIDDILENNNKNYKFIDETLYILQYPDRKLSVSYGILKEIYEDKKYDFNHNCSTKGGSSGSPILSSSNNKVIGMHKEGFKYNLYNKGIFLNYAVKDFIQKNTISVNYAKSQVNADNKIIQSNKNMIKIKNPFRFSKEKKSIFNIKNIMYNKNIGNNNKRKISDKFNMNQINPNRLLYLLSNKKIRIQRNLNINNNDKLLKIDLNNNNFNKNMINKIILNKRNNNINKNIEKKIMDFIKIYKTFIKRRFWNEFKEKIKIIKHSVIGYSTSKNIISQSYLYLHLLKEKNNSYYLYESFSNEESVSVHCNSLDNDCLHSMMLLIKSQNENS